MEKIRQDAETRGLKRYLGYRDSLGFGFFDKAFPDIAEVKGLRTFLLDIIQELFRFGCADSHMNHPDIYGPAFCADMWKGSAAMNFAEVCCQKIVQNGSTPCLNPRYRDQITRYFCMEAPLKCSGDIHGADSSFKDPCLVLPRTQNGKVIAGNHLATQFTCIHIFPVTLIPKLYQFLCQTEAFNYLGPKGLFVLNCFINHLTVGFVTHPTFGWPPNVQVICNTSNPNTDQHTHLSKWFQEQNWSQLLEAANPVHEITHFQIPNIEQHKNHVVGLQQQLQMQRMQQMQNNDHMMGNQMNMMNMMNQQGQQQGFQYQCLDVPALAEDEGFVEEEVYVDENGNPVDYNAPEQKMDEDYEDEAMLNPLMDYDSIYTDEYYSGHDGFGSTGLYEEDTMNMYFAYSPPSGGYGHTHRRQMHNDRVKIRKNENYMDRNRRKARRQLKMKKFFGQPKRRGPKGHKNQLVLKTVKKTPRLVRRIVRKKGPALVKAVEKISHRAQKIHRGAKKGINKSMKNHPGVARIFAPKVYRRQKADFEKAVRSNPYLAQRMKKQAKAKQMQKQARQQMRQDRKAKQSEKMHAHANKITNSINKVLHPKKHKASSTPRTPVRSARPAVQRRVAKRTVRKTVRKAKRATRKTARRSGGRRRGRRR